MTRDPMRKWREANPWEIVNLRSLGTACGRFPTREAAVECAESYRGGVAQVDDATRRVYVAEVPSL